MKRIRARGLDVERELRELRPQPREELVRALAARMHASARSRSHGSLWLHRGAALRVALGSGVTALFVAALVPAGGLGYASGAVSRAASAVEHTVTVTIGQSGPASKPGNPQRGTPATSPGKDQPAHRPTSGHHQYGIPICHRTHSGQLVLIRVSREALPAHLTHHGDIIPAPRHGCR